MDFGGRSTEELDREYDRLDGTDSGRILDTDKVRELNREYVADPAKSARIHRAASAWTRERFTRMLAKPVAAGRNAAVQFLAGGGSGKSTVASDVLGNLNPDIIYDGTLSNLERAREDVRAALTSGRDVHITYVYRSPKNSAAGAIRRAVEKGRPVPIEALAAAHADAPAVIRALAKEYNGNPRVKISAIWNDGAREQAHLMPVEGIPDGNREAAYDAFRSALESARTKGQINDRLYAAFGGREGSSAQAGRASENGHLDNDAEGNVGSPRERAESGGQPQPKRVGGDGNALTDTADPRSSDIAYSRTTQDRAGVERRGASGPGAEPSTGIKNAQVAAERAERGLDELHVAGKRDYGQIWDKAAATLKADPQAGERLAQAVANKPRALTPEEGVMLAQDRARLSVERRQAAQAVNEAVISKNQTAEANARLRLFEANQKLDINDLAARNSGYEQGLSLSVRRIMAALDYSQDAMEQRLSAAKGAPLDEKDLKVVKDLHEQMQEVESQLAGRQEAQRGRQKETKAQLGAQLREKTEQWRQATERQGSVGSKSQMRHG